MSLRIRDLHVHFGGLHVLRGVDAALRTGACTGLSGANGSGKTTLIAVIAGALPTPAGTVLLDDADVSALPVQERARLGIRRMFQDSRLWEDLSVAEHLQATCDFMPRSRVGMAALVERHGLRESFASRPAELALLQRRRLELCMALYGARYLLCDELGAGLDHAEASELYATVTHAVASRWIDGALMVEHRQALLEAACNHLANLEDGRWTWRDGRAPGSSARGAAPVRRVSALAVKGTTT